MAQKLKWPDKDALDVLDYTLNWKAAPAATDQDPTPIAVLDGAEQITSVAHVIVLAPSNDADNPLVIDSENTFDGNQQTVVVLSGGVAGKYEVDCTIVTDNVPPRTYNRKVKLKVKDL